jgi:hypothetical protein
MLEIDQGGQVCVHKVNRTCQFFLTIETLPNGCFARRSVGVESFVSISESSFCLVAFLTRRFSHHR